MKMITVRSVRAIRKAAGVMPLPSITTTSCRNHRSCSFDSDRCADIDIRDRSRGSKTRVGNTERVPTPVPFWSLDARSDPEPAQQQQWQPPATT